MKSSICNICTNSFNKKNVCISCPYCKFDACRICWQMFFENEGKTICMNKKVCNKEWDRYQLCERMTANFMKQKYTKMLENQIFDSQKKLFPETIDYIQQQKETNIMKLAMRRIEDDRIEKMSEIKRLKVVRSNDPSYPDFIKEKNRLIIEIDELGSKIQNYKVMINNGGDYISSHMYANTPFIKRCLEEKCRGYLSDEMSCKLCNSIFCKKCHIKLDESEHKCRADDIANIALLKENTKPCPKCSEGIFKTDGCDQMWCTCCHTAFSWETGEIQTKIHNPHYYEWMRQNNKVIPRAEGDIINDCVENNPDIMFMRITSVIMRELKKIGSDNNIYRMNEIIQTIRIDYNHNRRFVIPQMIHEMQGNDLSYRKLRVDYLKKYITEEKFKTKILKLDKHIKTTGEIIEIGNLFTDVLTDLIINFDSNLSNIHNAKNLEDTMVAFLDECEELLIYINNLIENVCKIFMCKDKSKLSIKYMLNVLSRKEYAYAK